MIQLRNAMQPTDLKCGYIKLNALTNNKINNGLRGTARFHFHPVTLTVINR